MPAMYDLKGGDNKQTVDDSSEEEPDYKQLKIIVVGDGAVGKTSLIQRFCNDHFANSYKQTIGVDFCVKRLTLPPNHHVCLQIWDIGGQSIGGKMIESYIHKSDAVLLCYDISSWQSFENLKDWLGLVRKAGVSHVSLVGTKSDLNHIRAVKAVRHQQYAEEEEFRGAHFVSAKMNDNVDLMFTKIAADLCGVTLTGAMEQACQKPVTAEIINHPRHDPSHPEVTAQHLGKEKDKKCNIM